MGNFIKNWCQRQKDTHQDDYLSMENEAQKTLSVILLVEDLQDLKLFNLDMNSVEINNFVFYSLQAGHLTIIVFNYLLKASLQCEQSQFKQVLNQFLKHFFGENFTVVEYSVYFIKNNKLKFRYKDMLEKQFHDLLQNYKRELSSYKFQLIEQTYPQFQHTLANNQSRQQFQ